MEQEVFISHSSKNADTAIAICQALERAGIGCWIAPRNIPTGTQYGEQIMKGIRQCKVFLLVFSDAVNYSDNVQKELERASFLKKSITPFRIEKVSMNDNIDYFLGGLQWLDAVQDDEEFADLISAISKLLGKDDNVKIANKFFETAQKYYDSRDYSAATKFFSEALELYKSTLGEKNQNATNTLDMLIESYVKVGDTKTALELNGIRLLQVEELNGRNSIEYAKELCRIAYRRDHLGEYREALQTFNAALDIINHHHPENKHEIAYIKLGIGSMYLHLHEYAEAIICYKSVGEHFNKNTCLECREIYFETTVYCALGTTYSYINYEEAMFYFEKAVALGKAIMTEDIKKGWVLANVYKAIGIANLINRDLCASIESHKKALEVRKFSNDSPIAIARASFLLAEAYIADTPDINNLKKMMADRNQKSKSNDPFFAEGLKLVELANEKLTIAIDYLKNAIKIRKERMGENSILLAEVFELLAVAYEKTEEPNYEMSLECLFNAYRTYVVNKKDTSDILDLLETTYQAARSKELNLETWLGIRMNNFL